MSDMKSVNDIIDMIEQIDPLETQLFFVEKSRSGYTSYTPNTTKALRDKILDLILDYVKHRADDLVETYNPVIHSDDSVESLPVDKIENFSDVIDTLKSSIISLDGVSPDSLTFYVLHLRDKSETKNVYIFRRTTKFKKLNTSGFFGQFWNNTFNEFDSKLIGIDGFADIIVLDGKAFIFSHIALDRIFRMKEQYSQKAAEALKKLKSKSRIANFDDFEDDCLSDLRVQKTLTKLLAEEDVLDNALNDFGPIKETIETFDLDIDIISNAAGEEQLNYSPHDKINLMSILQIIRDAYYISTIQKRKGIDKAG